MVAALFMACSQNDEMTLPETDGGKEYTVSLNMTPEVANIETGQIPMSKAGNGTEDLYIIKIYKKHKNDHLYSYHSHGIFNRKEQLTLTMRENYTYNFYVTMIKNYRDELYNATDSTFYWLHLSTRKQFKIENKLVSTEEYPDPEEYFHMYEKEGKGAITYYHSHMYRYYGRLLDYTPVENGSIDIDLYLALTGMKFEVEGLTHGKLTFNGPTYNIGTTTQTSYTLTKDTTLYWEWNCSPEYAYQGANGDPSYIYYYNNSEFDMKWTGEDGTTININSPSVYVYRLKYATYKLTLKQGSTMNGTISVSNVDSKVTAMEAGDSYSATTQIP